MGLMRWLRGGDENSATANAMGAGMAEIDALFRPSKHKQTEHVQESRRRRVDVHNGAASGVDLDSGLAVIRRRGDDERGETAAAADDAATERIDDAATAPTGDAPQRRHAPITRRGASRSPATLTVAAATVEPKE